MEWVVNWAKLQYGLHSECKKRNPVAVIPNGRKEATIGYDNAKALSTRHVQITSCTRVTVCKPTGSLVQFQKQI